MQPCRARRGPVEVGLVQEYSNNATCPLANDSSWLRDRRRERSVGKVTARPTVVVWGFRRQRSSPHRLIKMAQPLWLKVRALVHPMPLCTDSIPAKQAYVRLDVVSFAMALLCPLAAGGGRD